MKRVKYLVLPLAIMCINVAQAGAKQVNLPFKNEPIFSVNHEGLFFNYDMSGKNPKKVVCQLSYVYKGWFVYRHQSTILEAGPYGDADGFDTVNFTSKGQTEENQYHADLVGAIKVNAVKNAKAPYASASCHYAFDDNP